jgi:vacuolar-type H+-ATPase subunit E/Vma4
MKPQLPAGAEAALAPVKTALLARARSDADAALQQARDRAAEIRTDAHRRAQQLLTESRADGERQAGAAVAGQLTRQRRQARAAVLAAQRELHERLRRECRDAARALRADPDYPTLRAQLTRSATAVLGPDADVRESPDGGVIATAGSRLLDLSLPALADREVDRLGADVMRLWAT